VLGIIAAAIFVTHRANLARLARGEEARIDLGKKTAS
jgi:glycerol-3-phosphate acyltransferase PlsY